MDSILNYIKRLYRKAFHERAIICLLITAASLYFLGSFRPDNVNLTGLNPNRFWSMKMDWNRCADVVVAGDSRVLMGISPDAMNTHLHDRVILNYGFHGNGYSVPYLESLDNLLNPRSNDKILLMGITHCSVVPSVIKTNGFHKNIQRKKERNFINRHFDEFLWDMRPLKMLDIANVLLGQTSVPDQIHDFRTDGWSAVTSNKRTIISSHTLNRYRQSFIDNQVNPEIITDIINTVKKWTAAGIAVYAFCPPTSIQVSDIENSMCGLNEKDFITQFENAGGTWIDVHPGAYETYDANHLELESAEKLSKFLAHKIFIEQQDRLARQTKTSIRSLSRYPDSIEIAESPTLPTNP